MITSDEELSSDLEFLLQNGKDAGPVLVEALVREFYAPVYRLGLAICDDPDCATIIAIETFVAAAMDVHDYHAEAGALSWIYARALKFCHQEYRRVWRKRFFKAVLPVFRRPLDFGSTLPESELDATLWLAVDALPEQQRLALLLHDLAGLGEEEIAHLMRVEPGEVLDWLTSAWRRAWKKLERSGDILDLPKPLQIDHLLGESLVRRFPQPEFSAEEIELITQEIQSQVARRTGRLRRSIYGKEIMMTILVSLVAVGLIWGVNRLLPVPQPAAVGALRTGAVPPTPGPSPTPLRVARADYYILVDYYSPSEDTLGSVAGKLGLPLSAWVNPQNDPQSTPNPAATVAPESTVQFRLRTDLENLPTAPPVQPVLLDQPLLNAQSSLEQVRSRIAQSESLWRTLWADINSIDYGPQGYSGPPLQAARVWTWLQLPNKSLVKVFGNGSPYSYPFLVKDGIGYNFIGNSVNAKPQEKLLDPGLADLLLPARSEWFKYGEPVRVLSQSSFAGRKVIIVQWEVAPGTKEYRPSLEFLDGSGYTSSFFSLSANDQRYSFLLTVDAQTGVVLRLRQYIDAHGRSTLVQDTVASQIAFDVDFNQPGLFDPLVTGLLNHTSDYRGHSYTELPEYVPAASALGHEQLPKVSPPPGYDPSGDWLTFQYTTDNNRTDNPAQADSTLEKVDLFAGKYFLRSLQFPQIYAMVCDRSPDGSTIAYLTNEYSSSGFSLDFGTAAWLDLRQPDEVHTPAAKLGVSDLTFSPNGRYLALAGYDAQSGDMGIYLLDMDNGKLEQLQTAVNAWSLVWSPDGKYLAFIGTINPQDQAGEGKMAAVVVDVSSKKITYHAEIPDEQAYVALFTLPVTQRDWPPADWPVSEWGIRFPVYRGMLGNCPNPPNPP